MKYLFSQAFFELTAEAIFLLVLVDIEFQVKSLGTNEGCINFIEKLIGKLEEVNGATGIGDMVRKNTTPKDVYDFVYSLDFIKSKYSLRFQNAEVEKLSPGQRGALLLIFYLLVDQDKTPIILDQPEENLDNDTVVNSLVPILNEAKKTRQIIMVTHNPNLAIVCDAEQIIYTDNYYRLREFLLVKVSCKQLGEIFTSSIIECFQCSFQYIHSMLI